MSSLYKYFSFLVSQLQRFFQLLLCHSLVPQQFYSAKKGNVLLKYVTLSIGILFCSMYLTSCEKVIQFDFDKVEKKYVIEAMIADQPNSCRVLLTQTKNFDENNTFTGISGAQVTITDNSGSPVTLTETSAGVYEAPTLTGVSGHTYNLKVNINGQTFTATSTMPALVPMDSIYITEVTVFNETYKFATVPYNDPAGIQNAYRFIQYVNGNKEETNFVMDDDLNDGLTTERILAYYDDDEAERRKLKSGDNVRVDMLCIDYPVYTYWFSLEQGATGTSYSATPGNPVTNITGGALGYFSAHTLQTKTVVVP